MLMLCVSLMLFFAVVAIGAYFYQKHEAGNDVPDWSNKWDKLK